MVAHPHIYLSGPVTATLERGFQGGVHCELEPGAHATWAARVPFIPTFLSDDFTRSAGREGGRIGKVVRRQFRFIYDLAHVEGLGDPRQRNVTYELRFIARPDPARPDQPARIDIVFLGKVFHPSRKRAEELAQQLWRKFHSNFPLEDPFNYPLQPLNEDEFAACYKPIPFDDITPDAVAEIRKFEDVPIEHREIRSKPGDYIAHPFVPALDFSAMSRFFETLSDQDSLCFASISLRPTRLWEDETLGIEAMVGRFRAIAGGRQVEMGEYVREGAQISAVEADRRIEDIAAKDEYIRSRARLGAAIYEALMKEQRYLFLVKIQVVGQQDVPLSLVEALGSELMDNAHNPYPSRWEMVQPDEGDEFQTAKNNLQWLEHAPWGDSKAAPEFRRLRYLVGAQEACGAFRLPIPPESGYMPGVLVKDEPFVAPTDYLEQTTQSQDDDRADANSESITVGEIYHRGNPTGRFFHVPVEDLTRHGLIAGSTGSGKTQTLLYLLTQLWRDHRIPFLVIYPIDKPDYRDLLAVDGLGNDLLIFTPGDPSTVPFCFNPFAVPEGVLVRTHMSRLLRCFLAAYAMTDPLPAVFRDALRRTYTQRGWDVVSDKGGAPHPAPTLADFYDAIQSVTSELRYGREIQANIRQAAEVRVRDLLENLGSVINTEEPAPLDTLLDKPVVMELGRIGSTEDTALVDGRSCLLLFVRAHRARRPRPSPHHRGRGGPPPDVVRLRRLRRVPGRPSGTGQRRFQQHPGRGAWLQGGYPHCGADAYHAGGRRYGQHTFQVDALAGRCPELRTVLRLDEPGHPPAPVRPHPEAGASSGARRERETARYSGARVRKTAFLARRVTRREETPS